MATYEQKILQKGAEITIVRIAPRSLDSDNLASSAKGVRDGIADALQINDNDARFAWVYEQRKGKPKEYAIEIRLKSKTAEG